MTAIKDVLCLLAIFIAYGIAGRPDYEDAVRLEQIRKEQRDADCLPASAFVVRGSEASINEPFSESRFRSVDEDLPEGRAPCAPRRS